MKYQRARSLEYTTGQTITLLKNRVCRTSNCPDTSSNLETAPSLDVWGLCNFHVCTIRLVRTCPASGRVHRRKLTMSAKCGNSVVFCTFWNTGSCCCVTMSASTTRTVCWRSGWLVLGVATQRYTTGTSTTLSTGCACLCIETSITLPQQPAPGTPQRLEIVRHCRNSWQK